MMGQEGKQHAELRRLLSAMDEGELTSEQEARLEQLVAEDVAARQFYLEYVFLVGKLRFDCGVGRRLLATSPGRSPVLGFLADVAEGINWQVHPVRFFTVAVLLTLLTWVGFYFYIRPALQGERKVAERPSEEVLPFVAKLRCAVDVQWGGDKAAAPQPGYHLRQGRKLELKSGLAEVVFNRGTKVILEGPCAFTLEGENAGDLQVGKLCARIQTEKARGFLVDTPFAMVTDLGTEFGVEVDDQLAQVAVYQGEVRVEVADTSGRKKAVRVTTGGTASVDRAGNLKSSSSGAEKLTTVREIRQPPQNQTAQPATPPDAADFVGRVLNVDWRSSNGNPPAMSGAGPAPDRPENTKWNGSPFPWKDRTAPLGDLRWSNGSSCPVVMEFPHGICSYNPPNAEGLAVFTGHVNAADDEPCIVRLRGLPTDPDVVCDLYVLCARNHDPLATRLTVGGQTIALPGDGPTDRFVAGKNFHIFRGVRPAADGTLDVAIAGDGGGVFSGLQLHVKKPPGGAGR